jgi:predicted RNase H-like HicB family nuclease
MRILEVIIERSEKNLSAYIPDVPIITVGKNLKEIEENIQEAIELYLEDNPNPAEILNTPYDFSFKIDAATFINYYSNVFTKAALSRITGINERQLWHYAAGLHKPRKRQLEKIQKGIRRLTQELNDLHFL